MKLVVIEFNHIDPLVFLLKILKVQVRAEERDDSWKSARTHPELFRSYSLSFDWVTRQGDWDYRQIWKFSSGV